MSLAAPIASQTCIAGNAEHHDIIGIAGAQCVTEQQQAVRRSKDADPITGRIVSPPSTNGHISGIAKHKLLVGQAGAIAVAQEELAVGFVEQADCIGPTACPITDYRIGLTTEMIGGNNIGKASAVAATQQKHLAAINADGIRGER